MNLGKIDLGGSGDVVKRRHPGMGGDGDTFHNDLPRLMLLLFMLVAAIAGYYVKERGNRPERVIARSVESMLESPFRASLEGSCRLRNITLDIYRYRHSYRPGGGLSETPVFAGSDGESSGESKPPFDPLSALEALAYAENVREFDREDMYGHGTRHFDGVLNMPGDDERTACVFEYWLDIRTLKAVRLIITKAERNVGVDDRGNTIPRETFVNIRYF